MTAIQLRCKICGLIDFLNEDQMENWKCPHCPFLLKQEGYWTKSDEELPPCDGKYEVTNDRFSLDLSHFGILDYDGFGFTDGISYKNPAYWRPYRKLEKKYGKIEK